MMSQTTGHDTTGGQPLSLCDPLLAHAAQRPEHPAVRGPLGADRVTLSYRELAAAIAGRAAALREAGLRPGQRIGLISPTCPEFLIEFFAAEACGAVIVCLNPLSTDRELDFILTDAQAAHLSVHPACASPGTEVAARLGLACHRIPLLDGRASEAGAGAGAEFTPHRRGPEECVVLLYTSGTTGSPKGAMLSAGTLRTGAETGRRIAALTPDDRFGTALPLFHVFGLASTSYPMLCAGGTLSLLPRFDAAELLATMRADALTVVAGVPTMWNALTHLPESAEETPQLRLALSGGAAISVELMRAFNARFGATIAEGYGLTETCAFGTFNPIDGVIKPGSVGLPVPTMEVRVVDPLTGADCAAGETGEVLLRGPLLMTGYWQRPEATAEAFDAAGFFRTGDLGQFDDDGYLFIVDRLKDLIIHGGYNVYPREVEEVLYAHPDVFEAAVIGVEDAHYGQQVAAVVTPLPGRSLTAAEVEDWCRSQLSAYKIPRIIRLVDGLPKGPTGKIRKRSIEL